MHLVQSNFNGLIGLFLIIKYNTLDGFSHHTLCTMTLIKYVEMMK